MELSDKIDQYIQGLMPDAERRTFEAQIAKNPHLETAVRLRKELCNFGTVHKKRIDTLIQNEEVFMDEITLNEWDLPANKALVETLKKISFYANETDLKEAQRWLNTDAIMYPELVEEILVDTDKHRFNESSLTQKEIKGLQEKIREIYDLYLSIDSAVDDYLYAKHNGTLPKIDIPAEFRKTKTDPVNKTHRSASIFRSRRFFLLSIAAVSVLLVSFILVWALLLKTTSPDQLYASFYKPLVAPVEMRGSDDAQPDLFKDAIATYNAKDYPAAYAALNAIPAEDPNYIPACLFAGIAAMENKLPKEAIVKFDQVVAAGETNLKGDAQWYQALCYLKMGDIVQSRQLLTVLSKHPFYKDQATKLLSEL